MRKVLITIAAALAAAGCADTGGRQAERQYRIVERHGTPDEICLAARDVADAYLKAEDEQGYRRWQATAMLKCNGAALQ
jgi:hypothetical protein